MPMGIEVTTRKARKFEPRKIAHPNFKNISLSDAVKLLKNAKNGEFIIRPSSKGKQYLAISWKFFDEVFVHLSLKEEVVPGEKFRTILVLDNKKETFENFDEIIERYIQREATARHSSDLTNFLSSQIHHPLQQPHERCEGSQKVHSKTGGGHREGTQKR